MEKKYSKKEHDKCQRVADAFSELYEMYGDMCVVDAGKLNCTPCQGHFELV